MQNNNLQNTCAIILCGGKGSRLGPLGKKKNKTLIKYNGYPLIHHLIKYLQKYSVGKIIIPLGYDGMEIKKYLNKNFKLKELISFNAGLNTNIINRVKKSLIYIDKKIDNIILLNGDSFYKFDLAKLINKKVNSKKLIIKRKFNSLNARYT